MENMIRKKLLDSFSKYVMSNYNNYCRTHNLDANNPETIITYLVDNDLINPKAIKDYTISHEYENLLHQKKHKTETVTVLASMFNISERSVWTALRGRR